MEKPMTKLLRSSAPLTQTFQSCPQSHCLLEQDKWSYLLRHCIYRGFLCLFFWTETMSTNELKEFSDLEYVRWSYSGVSVGNCGKISNCTLHYKQCNATAGVRNHSGAMLTPRLCSRASKKDNKCILNHLWIQESNGKQIKPE